MIKNSIHRFSLYFILFIATQAFPQDPSWLSEISTVDDFTMISIKDSSRQDLLRATKYLAPASDDPSLLQTVYQNSNQYLLHLEFMVNEFPERFAGLTSEEYMAMVLNSQTRTYFAGAIFQFRDRQGDIVYGFNVYASPSDLPQADAIFTLYNRLSQSMKLRPFAYSPITTAEIEQAKRWENPGFPIYLPTGLIEPEYEAYSPSINYGRVRRYTLDNLENAVTQGQIGWQDIVVVDIAPTDIETVVAGIITGTRQGELSHVNVRSIRRGTPNAYVQNPLKVFEPYEGQLIKLTVSNDQYKIEYPVELTEAEVWWSDHRPLIPDIDQPDDTFDSLVSLDDMQNLEFFDSLTSRFGGKASQLGILYSVFGQTILDGTGEIPFLVDGFAIPFRYYQEFMQDNLIPHPGDLDSLVTFEEYIQILMQDDRFRSDTAYRSDRLTYFIDYMRDHGTIDPDLVAKIVAKITDVYGSPEVKVRFRSSSNAEDDIAFNGAGLYDSTSVCAQDSLDGDAQGPSYCDAEEKNERTIERGLAKVWASLWKPIAYEERDYYQIDHRKSRMGILVSRAYPTEDNNGVAFTGDPVSGRKDYYVINVQQGDESVVQPDTGIIPEKDILQIDHGVMVGIQRARPSSIMPEGQWILTEEQLNEIGYYLIQIEQLMPVDTRGYSRDQIYFDVEFKYDQGQFVIKQIRPTLMASANQAPIPPEEVILTIPENTQLAATFNMLRTIQEEYQVHSVLDFKPGEYSLPLQNGDYELELIDQFAFGPERKLAVSNSPGILHVEAYNPPQNNVILRFDYSQSFLIDEKIFQLTIQGMQVIGENKSHYELILDHEYILNQIASTGTFEGGEYEELIPYNVPSDDQGQIYLHHLVLENNQHLRLYENVRRRVMGTGFIYAYLVYADGLLDGEAIRENDYWNLVYTAQGHTWNAKFWVLFDQPIGDAYGVAVLTTTLQWGAITEAEAYLLDQNLNHLRPLQIVSYTKEETDQLPDPNTGLLHWQCY